MTSPEIVSQFERVARRAMPGCRLLRLWNLAGGVSAQTTGLEVASDDGSTAKIVVRCHGEGDLRRNPNIARDEYRLLQMLHSKGLAVPKPLFFDASTEIMETPYIVLEYVDGETDINPDPKAFPGFLTGLASELAKIHKFDCSSADLSFLPDQMAVCQAKIGRRPERMDDSLEEERIRDVLQSSWPISQRNPSVLLHGDYWPGNIIWKDRQIAAVIDWEDAAIGDPLYDLSNSRLEVLWAFGEEGMRDFTSHYLSEVQLDVSVLPYWDLYAAIRPAGRLSDWGVPEEKVQVMAKRLSWFVEQAISSLSHL